MKVQRTCNAGIVDLSWQVIINVYLQPGPLNVYINTSLKMSILTKFFSSLKLQRHNYNRVNCTL